MSILIKGVTMPKNCFDCPMAFTVDFGILCTPTHYIVGDNEISKKQGFCPLVHVPPHGRLIDADALMKQIEHDTPLSAVFEKTIRRYLHNAPAIIPAEEDE